MSDDRPQIPTKSIVAFALWRNARKMKGSARASLYLYNTEEECKLFVDTLKDVAKSFA